MGKAAKRKVKRTPPEAKQPWGPEHRGLRLQLVLLRRGGYRGGLANPASAALPHD